MISWDGMPRVEIPIFFLDFPEMGKGGSNRYPHAGYGSRAENMKCSAQDTAARRSTRSLGEIFEYRVE